MEINSLPKCLDEITQAIVEGEGLNRDYLIVSALSAAASAIGISESLYVRGSWSTHAALFAVLVGRPGTGKTPPLNMMYKPLIQDDKDRYDDWRRDLTRWKALDKERRQEVPMPIFRQTVLSDCTPESALTEHWKNTRGITIYNDEILGFFKSMNRYSSGCFMEQLLSAWSGSSLKVTRKGEDLPMMIDDPCISMVGTIQPGRAHEIINATMRDNGLLDRILFCYPEDVKIPIWDFDNNNEKERTKLSINAQKRWGEIMKVLMQKPYPCTNPRDWTEKAREALYLNRNWEIVDINNRPEDDVDTRFAKRPIHLARLALVIQCIGEAAGEYPKENVVDLPALECALDLENYFTESLRRLTAKVKPVSGSICHSPEGVLHSLPDEFTIDEFNARCPGIAKERMGQRWRQELISDYKIVKIENNRFKKVC